MIRMTTLPFFLILFSLTLASCAQQTGTNNDITEQSSPQSKPEQGTSEQSNTEKEINAPTKNPSSNNTLTERKKITNIIRLQCDNNEQCKNIGIGHRACGGHTEYLAYSTKTTDITWLKKQVTLYNRAAKESNQLKGAMGVCMHLEQPKTSCAASQCVNSSNNNAF